MSDVPAVDISVIMITYQSATDVERSLGSLGAVLEGVSGEILVVESGSTDGSVDRVRDASPEAVVLEGHGNIGSLAAATWEQRVPEEPSCSS